MRKIDISPIATGIGFPVKKGTIAFLQQSYGELLSELVQELYPTTSIEGQVTAIRNCTWNNSSGTYTLQPGAIYVGTSVLYPAPEVSGEIFLLPAQQTITPSDHAILIFTAAQGITFYNPSDDSADPVVFTDNNPRNVHQIRTLVLADGDSSTPGFVCYLDLANPSGEPTNQYLQYPVSNFFKGSQTAAGPSVNIDDASVYTLLTFTPASPISSQNMTFRFTCDLL